MEYVSRPHLHPMDGELEGNRDLSRRSAKFLQQILGFIVFGSFYREYERRPREDKPRWPHGTWAFKLESSSLDQ